MEQLVLGVVLSKQMDWLSVKAVKNHGDQQCLMTKDSTSRKSVWNNVSGGHE